MLSFQPYLMLSLTLSVASLHKFDTVAPKSSKFPRTPTVEFSTTLPRRRARIEPLHEEEGLARPTISPLQPDDRSKFSRSVPDDGSHENSRILAPDVHTLSSSYDVTHI